MTLQMLLCADEYCNESHLTICAYPSCLINLHSRNQSNNNTKSREESPNPISPLTSLLSFNNVAEVHAVQDVLTRGSSSAVRVQY